MKQTTQAGIKQDATNSAGVLGTYRFWFGRHNGVEANYAWTTIQYNTFGVGNNSHEARGLRFPMPMKRWSPFVLGGAGTLIFDPKNFAAASTQTRAAFVYGGGADINLTDHFLRTRRISRICIQFADLRPCQFEGTRSRDASRGAHDRIRLEVLTGVPVSSIAAASGWRAVTVLRLPQA